MTPVILIPARMGSTRLPGKPLADIAGVPMIVQVYRRAVEANVGDVVVAADDQRIVDAVEAEGGKAVLTAVEHPSGSDRIWEALQIVDPDGHYDMIINIQGDLPTIDPTIVATVLDPFKAYPNADISTLVCKIDDEPDLTNPSVVKPVVAWDQSSANSATPLGKALYFTRCSAPYGDGPLYHHIGMYAYRRSALQAFVALAPSPLELREKLEQLRALEHGMTIAVAEVNTVPLGVDTQDQLEEARRQLA